MTLIEAYTYLFADSLFSNLIISLNSELVIDVMIMFNNYNNWLILILCVIASGISSMVNWSLGKILRTIKKTDDIIITNRNYEKLNEIFIKSSPLLLFFSFIPIIGPMISVLAGILRIRLLKIMIPIFLGKISYYSLKLFILN